MIAVKVAGAMSSETPRSALTAASPSPYRLVRSRPATTEVAMPEGWHADLPGMVWLTPRRPLGDRPYDRRFSNQWWANGSSLKAGTSR